MGLAERLTERRAEIEEAVLARVYGVADPAEIGDPAYVTGLREAVSAAVEYGLSATDPHPNESTPVPAVLLAQARHAAQSGVGLEVVLRRYLAGYALVGDFLIGAALEASSPDQETLRRSWRSLAAHFDHLLIAVASEHRKEGSRPGRNAEQRRAERVRRLLSGELVETADLDYELDGWHLGLIAVGLGAKASVRHLATALDCRFLMTQARGGAVWAWLGGQGRIDSGEALRVASQGLSPEVALAFGEPGKGIGGWRLTHRQARAAIPIAQRGTPNPVCYADVALLASALADEVLAGVLKETYLTPLQEGEDGGEVLRRTLCTYFAVDRNVSSAAAALGTSRQTVKNRLSFTEERIGRPLNAVTAELETALRLWELEIAKSNCKPGEQFDLATD